MKEIRDVLDRVCPCCGGNGWYAGTGTETVRGKDGCPEPSPCEVQVQCDCNGIKIAEIKKIVLGWVGSDEDNPCGRDCECSAHSEDECGCGVDWTNNRGKNALRAEIRKKIEGEL